MNEKNSRNNSISIQDRKISFGENLPAIPEKLLLAHAKGKVLFVCGAGISKPSGLPLFKELVVEVYRLLNSPVFAVINELPDSACNQWQIDHSLLTKIEQAQVKRFLKGEFDIALGLLERDIDQDNNKKIKTTLVRDKINEILSNKNIEHEEIHETLIKLSYRGEIQTIITTNFDLLLEKAAVSLNKKIQSYSIGSSPWPSITSAFSGILHIHGALKYNKNQFSNLIVTDEDFGDAYLRRRVVPDFMYDASRIFSIVLVGYTAEDPPMRYLLTSINGDENKFPDIKPRYVFVPNAAPEDELLNTDYDGRGITPIAYKVKNRSHTNLYQTLKIWSELSPFNADKEPLYREIKRIIQKRADEAEPNDRYLFEHFIKRSNNQERKKYLKFASDNHADIGWLDLLNKTPSEIEAID